MRSSFLVSVFPFISLLTGASSAFAEESAIRIIREDGSVTEYALPGGTPVLPPEETQPKTEQKKEIAPAPVPEKIMAAPVSSAPVPAQKKEKREAAPSPKRVRGNEAGAIHKGPPVPGRKPTPPEAAPEGPADRAIPQSLAVSIAIDHAPPAKNFKVSKRAYRDMPVYEILFYTEEGVYPVMVDARTGDIVPSK